MALDPIERLNYYQHQYVGAEDFRDQQAYHRDALRRHELGSHSWGIVTGCRLIEVPREGDDPFVDVYLLPGTAVDGFGRKIVVLEPVRIDPKLFSAYHGNNPVSLALWMQYDEVPARTATGGFAPCTDAEAYGRLTETYRFLVDEPPDRDPIMVGGDEAKLAAVAAAGDPVEPEDGSVPYQDFPDNERAARWPIRLGTVSWHGTPQKFTKTIGTGADAAEIEKNAEKIRGEGRVYAGFVGSAVLAEGPALRFAPRVAFADPDADPFASVEGQLRVDGRIIAKKDLYLHGGKVSWQESGGGESGKPLWIQRLGAGGKIDLRIHIGDTGSANTRLTVGPGPSEKVVLAVAGNDTVDIPTGTLRFDGPPRQVIDLALGLGTYGIGRHSGSIYYRSAAGHYWHAGGTHEDGDGDAGSGGDQLMYLSPGGGLHFSNYYRQFVNAVVDSQIFGIGAQKDTLYFRSANYFAWYLGGSQSPLQLDPGGGGSEAMRLDPASRLTVQGGVRSLGRVEIWGNALDFRTASGGIDTDIMEIQRVNTGSDNNDLRITIGDNMGGGDRLIVGPRYSGDGQFYEQFVVENNGDVRVARDLYVRGSKIPLIDVVSGNLVMNRPGGSGIAGPIVVPSTGLTQVGSAEVILALTDIGNDFSANDARWRVEPVNKTIVPPNKVSFNIAWTVGDSDGWLYALSYIVIFRP